MLTDAWVTNEDIWLRSTIRSIIEVIREFAFTTKEECIEHVNVEALRLLVTAVVKKIKQDKVVSGVTV